jgi:hypothetical protein
MRTTIELPDALFRRAKARAALDGISFKDLVTRYVDEGLNRGEQLSAAEARRRRSELPLARAATGEHLPALSNAEIHRILDNEEVAHERDR